MKEWEEVLKINGVTFYQPVETIEETRRKMRRTYDKCNEVFKNRPELFVDEKTLKKNKENVFI